MIEVLPNVIMAVIIAPFACLGLYGAVLGFVGTAKVAVTLLGKGSELQES